MIEACHFGNEGNVRTHVHSWNWTILRSAELMQNVLQDHKNLHVAE